MAEKRYSAADIRVLEGLEPVRVRPGMYVGGTNTRALHHLLWEVVDNAVDEALAGRCSTVRVELTDDEVVTVTDDGRGIPVDLHPEQQVSALELVFTKLHAGGKFGDGGYKVSGGLHGVGASVTNALSDWLEVEVRRDKRLWVQRYRRGVPDGPVRDVRALAKGEGTGTRVRFTPDRTIFDRNAHFSATTVQQRLREKSFLVRGLTFELVGPDGVEHVYRSEEGLADYVRELNESRDPAHPGVVSVSGESGGIPIEIALQWTNAAEDRLYGFCNVVNTVDGGTHVSGLRRALTRVLNQAASDAGRLKKDKGETLDAKDVADGLTGAVSVMLEDPQFEGQTKGRLNNQEAQTAVAAFAGQALADWLADKRNADDAKRILDRVLLARDVRLAKAKISKKLRNAATSIMSDSHLPGKLADTIDNPAIPAVERELFIVEGDSAGGSAKQARDNATQAILPIRGKILNVLGAKNGKAFDNAEVDSILVALGGRKDVIGSALVATLDEDQLRYGKVVITADADADGAHIANLLITLFHELFPALLQGGRVFIARPPLFRVALKDGAALYVHTEDELKAALKAHKRTGDHVTRFKGLGEMNAEHLRETVFDPATRRLLQVSMEDAAEAANTVELVMGSNPAPRRAWLEESAGDAEVLV
ncbi:MAG: type IIA DNA topoisomerase subunit B [Actinomycetota bacterium]